MGSDGARREGKAPKRPKEAKEPKEAEEAAPTRDNGVPRAARAKRKPKDASEPGASETEKTPGAERDGRADASDTAERLHRTNGSDRAERSGKSRKGDKAKRRDRSDRSAKRAKTAKAERAEGPERPEGADGARKSSRRERRPEEPEAPGRPRTEAPGALDAADAPAEPPPPAAAGEPPAAAPAAAAPAAAPAAGRASPARERRGPLAAAALDGASAGSSAASGSRGASPPSDGGSSASASASGGERRRRSERRRAREAAAGGASGFSAPLAPPPPPPPSMTAAEAKAAGAAAYGLPAQSMQLAVLPEKVRGLLDNRDSLAQEVLRMKQVVEAHQSQSNFSKDVREEGSETALRMPPRLHECLLHPDNEPRLLARTGLAAAALNEDGLVILRAHTRKGLAKALSQLRRVAYHCQWGCSQAKVSALLADKPAKPVHSMVVRLAATSSRLQSHEARLTLKLRKLRIGTQASACQLVIDGIPGLSRRHCTITFEPEKAACYVQDLSTNGTYLNGKRLPRPPYKNPQDARVRLFHGDEMFFRLRSEDAEELGYVVNLFELG